MEFMQEIVGLVPAIEKAKKLAAMEESLGSTFDQATAFIAEHSGLEADKQATFLSVMTKDLVESAGQPEKAVSLKESLDEQFQADVELIESAAEVCIVGLYDILIEAFVGASVELQGMGQPLEESLVNAAQMMQSVFARKSK